jgi:uncharacterized membrane protein YeaQ/YmgE (transglycosylase-associated protein family)
MNILVGLILGLGVGWLASRFLERGGAGALADLPMGATGALIGGILASRVLSATAGLNPGILAIAVLSAAILVAIPHVGTGYSLRTIWRR